MTEALAEDACEKVQQGGDKQMEALKCPTVGSADEARELVQSICDDTFVDVDVMLKLPCVFGELDCAGGLYIQIAEGNEQKRVVCAMGCVFWLLGNRYKSFIEPQPFNRRMSESLWAEYQDFVHSFDLTPDMIHTVLVRRCSCYSLR